MPPRVKLPKQNPKLNELEAITTVAINEPEKYVQLLKGTLQEEPENLALDLKLRPLPTTDFAHEAEDRRIGDAIRKRGEKVFKPQHLTINTDKPTHEPANLAYELKMRPTPGQNFALEAETGLIDDLLRLKFTVNQCLRVGNIIGAEQFLGRKLTSEEIMNKSITDPFAPQSSFPDYTLEQQRQKLKQKRIELAEEQRNSRNEKEDENEDDHNKDEKEENESKEAKEEKDHRGPLTPKRKKVGREIDQSAILSKLQNKTFEEYNERKTITVDSRLEPRYYRYIAWELGINIPQGTRKNKCVELINIEFLI